MHQISMHMRPLQVLRPLVHLVLPAARHSAPFSRPVVYIRSVGVGNGYGVELVPLASSGDGSAISSARARGGGGRCRAEEKEPGMRDGSGEELLVVTASAHPRVCVGVYFGWIVVGSELARPDLRIEVHYVACRACVLGSDIRSADEGLVVFRLPLKHAFVTSSACQPPCAFSLLDLWSPHPSVAGNYPSILPRAPLSHFDSLVHGFCAYAALVNCIIIPCSHCTQFHPHRVHPSYLPAHRIQNTEYTTQNTERSSCPDIHIPRSLIHHSLVRMLRVFLDTALRANTSTSPTSTSTSTRSQQRTPRLHPPTHRAAFAVRRSSTAGYPLAEGRRGAAADMRMLPSRLRTFPSASRPQSSAVGRKRHARRERRGFDSRLPPLESSHPSTRPCPCTGLITS
ncbi:hypothetical protein DFH06DRAFT_55443 [Mycena polygramma]|nr:hypothetical protein DFH06DRAFT_55443 [Mycena polygramma]